MRSMVEGGIHLHHRCVAGAVPLHHRFAAVPLPAGGEELKRQAASLRPRNSISCASSPGRSRRCVTRSIRPWSR